MTSQFDHKPIVVGNYRIEVYQNGVVRLEYSEDNSFCDENTLFVPDRSDMGLSNATLTQTDGCYRVAFGNYVAELPKNTTNLRGVKLYCDGKVIYRYKFVKMTGELPRPNQTPNVFAIMDTPRVTVPKQTYSSSGADGFAVQNNVYDLYLLICNGNHKLLRKQFVELTGRAQMPRISVFGLWYSRYFPHSEQSVADKIREYKLRNVPIDNFVVDTDWRIDTTTGTGYQVNSGLFPDLPRFFDNAHANGVEIMFNDHPAPLAKAKNVLSSGEIAFREQSLTSLLQQGLDTWWYDRNWFVHLKSPTKRINEETFGLFAYWEITKHFYQCKSNNDKVYTRPVIMGNLNNIVNGWYLGEGFYKINDVASHRYPIQWTGDIGSSTSALAREIFNLISAGNNCFPYISCDVGGHTDISTEREFVRWMQFGCFSPVLRPHCADYVKVGREPWAYGEKPFEIIKKFIDVRYALLPLIYQRAYNNYVTGEPIFKSLSYNYPTDSVACNVNDEYLLGDNLLIAPVYYKMRDKVPPRYFVGKVKAEYFDGIDLTNKVCTKYYDDLFRYWVHTKPHSNVPAHNFSARYSFSLKFDRDVLLKMHAGNGARVYLDGKLVMEDTEIKFVTMHDVAMLYKDKQYDVVIEYFYQHKGDASIALYYECDVPDAETDGKSVYLPQGKWIDLFGGKVYDGCQTVTNKYSVEQMPLFVRQGAIIPLAYPSCNAKTQNWEHLALDYYPSKTQTDSGFLYEDDKVTTAYQYGKYNICNYTARFDVNTNRYVLHFEKPQGTFERAKRILTIKTHLFEGDSISKVLFDGKDVPFEVLKKSADSFVFDVNGGSATEDVAICQVELFGDTENTLDILLK